MPAIITFAKNERVKANSGLTGIILSGGKSSRMGMEKGLCLLDGKPLIEYSVRLLEQVCNTILIGANTDAYDYLGFPVIKDEFTGIGPIGGIYSCLNHSSTNDNLVLSCDIPLIPVDLIHAILSHKDDFQVVIPLSDGLPEPLCAFYRKDILPVIERAIYSGKYKIQDAIKDTRYKFLDFGENGKFSSKIFTNINTLDDLEEMENYLKHKRTV